jgi:hypothetical protein
MCTIQENDNKNKVIELADKVIQRSGRHWLLVDVHKNAKKINALANEITNPSFLETVAEIETALDILKHHYNIGREVTTAKANHLKTLETLIK